MGKLRTIALAGLLALAAPAAFAIPFGVQISGGAGGSWDLTGPTNLSDTWLLSYDNVFDIQAGDYKWSISGGGICCSASWRLFLDDVEIYSGSASGFFFKVRDSHDFEVIGTTVPEPMTLSLLGIALAGLGFSIRRKASRV